ncbi:MAG: 4Fe-4S dicluster domain-containing protein [Bacillota bacterium]
MRIDKIACNNCGLCILYCPVDAIAQCDGIVIIDEDECTECRACVRANVCRKSALYQPPLTEPRIWRALFSDTLTSFPDTDVAGRGTDEAKTNDVTGRFRRGQVGFGVELGRPGVGSRFRDVEKVAMALAPLGVEFEPLNPATGLIIDKKTGKMRDDILNEKVISAIIEFKVPQKRVPEVMKALESVAQEIDTVFSLDIIQRAEPDGRLPMIDEFKRLGYFPSENGKVCIGIGRPRAC